MRHSRSLFFLLSLFYPSALTIRTALFDGSDKRNRAAILQTADTHFKNGEVAAALALYIQFLQSCRDPLGTSQEDYYYALLLSGNCYYLEGKVDESKRSFYDAAEIQPKDAQFCSHGTFTIQDVLFKLIREVNCASRFGNMLERVKWMAKDVGSKVKPGGRSRRWQTWLTSSDRD